MLWRRTSIRVAGACPCTVAYHAPPTCRSHTGGAACSERGSGRFWDAQRGGSRAHRAARHLFQRQVSRWDSRVVCSNGGVCHLGPAVCHRHAAATQPAGLLPCHFRLNLLLVNRHWCSTLRGSNTLWASTVLDLEEADERQVAGMVAFIASRARVNTNIILCAMHVKKHGFLTICCSASCATSKQTLYHDCTLLYVTSHSSSSCHTMPCRASTTWRSHLADTATGPTWVSCWACCGARSAAAA